MTREPELPEVVARRDADAAHAGRRPLPALLGDPAYRFAFAVIAAAIGLAVWFAFTGQFALLAHPPDIFIALIVLSCIGELVPLRGPRALDDSRYSASTPFGFAAMVMYGVAPGALAWGLSCALADTIMRKHPVKTGFNAAQYFISVAAAGGVMSLVSDLPHTHGAALQVDDLPAVAIAAAVMFTGNNIFSSAVTALATGTSMLQKWREEMAFMVLIEGLLLSFTPVVVVATDFSPWLLLPIALPFAAVYYSAREAARRDHEASHDALTGLPNRALFGRALAESLVIARRTNQYVGVMLLDLDRFKEVNDTLGHGHGDRLLELIGRRLARAVRESDMVARLGGDEFGVLLRSLPSTGLTLEAAERIRTALDRPFLVGGLRLRADASIGIAWSPGHAGDEETLLRCADVAMYRAKDGRTGTEVYDAEHDPYSPARLALTEELREGIEDGQLVLHYQPKLDLASGEVSGAEALVRWQHPAHGLLPPSEFIPLAERTDLIGALTMWVLKESLTRHAEWRSYGLNLPVSVNMPAQSLLDGDLPATVGSLLEALGVPASGLVLEITEGSLIHDPRRSAAILARLDEMGVRIAIDDFGTGYSSLAWLKRFPFHEIKVDRSFVHDLESSPSDAAIVRSTIELGRSLGLATVAEGVETPGELSRLTAWGCDMVQGYLVSRPLPPAELLEWVRMRRSWSLGGSAHPAASRPA